MDIFFHCPKALVQVQFGPDVGWGGRYGAISKTKNVALTRNIGPGEMEAPKHSSNFHKLDRSQQGTLGREEGVLWTESGARPQKYICSSVVHGESKLLTKRSPWI